MHNDYTEFFRIVYRFFADGTRLTYASIGVGLLVAFLLFKILFRDVSGYVDDNDTAFKVPIVNADYDYVDSRWSRGKIWVWLFVSIGMGIAAYYQLPDWFPHAFKAPQ